MYKEIKQDYHRDKEKPLRLYSNIEHFYTCPQAESVLLRGRVIVNMILS